MKVIVVGAGCSGLNCARTLVASGVEVCVIEASANIGGRLQQVAGLLRDRLVDAGAEFVHGTVNEVVDLARQGGWGLRQIFPWSQGDGGPGDEPAPDGGVGYYWADGKLMTFREAEEDPELSACHEALWGLGSAEAKPSIRPGQTLAEYLTERGITAPKARRMACAGYGNTCSGSLSTISAERAASFERSWEKDGEEADYRLDASYRIMTEWLVRQCRGAPIVTSAPVASVNQLASGPHRCRVELSATCRPAGLPQAWVSRAASTDRGVELSADAVVLSVPPNVLAEGDIRFAPPLSPRRLASLGRIPLVRAAKVLMCFHRRCWPEDCHGMVCAGPSPDGSEPGGEPWIVIPEMWFTAAAGTGGLVHLEREVGSASEAQAEGGEGAVALPPRLCSVQPGSAGLDAPFLATGFLMGPRAEKMLQLPASTLLMRAVAQIDRVFGMGAGAPGAFAGGRVMDWKTDFPFVRGAYTGPLASEAPGDRAVISAPHPETASGAGARVFFCGEATSGASEAADSPLTVHGSMRTGERAAREVLRRLEVRARL